jgi:hypothetical protein
VLGAVPTGARDTVPRAAREGFLAGMTEIFVLAGLLALGGLVLNLFLVREHEIEHRPLHAEMAPEPARA